MVLSMRPVLLIIMKMYIPVTVIVIVTIATHVVCLQPTGRPTTTTIQVCQNKACCQRWKLKTPLPDVLHDLVYYDDTTNNGNINSDSNSNNDGNNKSGIITIDTVSCLGQCDKGPNMRAIATTTAQPDVYINGINDPISLITQLDELLSITVPSKLLAAVNVFDKAQTVSTLEEKQRYTSSILRVLDEGDDLLLRMSTANARARIYQAELILEAGNVQEAIDEVTKSIQQLSSFSTKTIFHTNLLGKAYRVAADAYEQRGDYIAAIQSIQSMAGTNPDMRTKVTKELERLQQLAAV